MKRLIYFLFLIFTTPTVAGCYERVDLKDIGSKTPAYKCEDGTVSFAQNTRYSDRKEKKDDYESLCGAVAAANVFHAYCEKLFVNHMKIGTKYFWDMTPGIRPDTLEGGLNEMFDNNPECMSGEWKYYYSTNRWNFLDSLYYEVRRGNGEWVRKQSIVSQARRSPVIVLISRSNDAKILHYVTVVDIIGYDPKVGDYENDECKVIYNDFGGQTEKACSKFVKYANQVDNQLLTSMLREYTHLVFEPTALGSALQSFKRMSAKKSVTGGLRRTPLKGIKDIHTRK